MSDVVATGGSIDGRVRQQHALEQSCRGFFPRPARPRASWRIAGYRPGGEPGALAARSGQRDPELDAAGSDLSRSFSECVVDLAPAAFHGPRTVRQIAVGRSSLHPYRPSRRPCQRLRSVCLFDLDAILQGRIAYAAARHGVRAARRQPGRTASGRPVARRAAEQRRAGLVRHQGRYAGRRVRDRAFSHGALG